MRLLLLIFFLSAVFAWSGDTLVVLNKTQAKVSFIDPQSGEILRTLPTGDGPHEAATSADGKWAVVTNYGQSRGGQSLTLIDLKQNKVARTVDIEPYSRPHGIVWSADGEHVWVTVEENRAIIKVDPFSSKISAVVETGQSGSHMVVIGPKEKRAFVANIGSGTVSVLDLKKQKLIQNITTGGGAEGIDITPNGKEVWVTNREVDTVSVIDTKSLKVVAEMPCASFPIRVKITPDGKHALVSNAASGEVVVFDVAEKKEVKRIRYDDRSVPVLDQLGDRFDQGSVPIGILIEPGGKRAYVAHTRLNVITVLDLEAWQVTAYFEAGERPDGMTWVSP